MEESPASVPAVEEPIPGESQQAAPVGEAVPVEESPGSAPAVKEPIPEESQQGAPSVRGPGGRAALPAPALAGVVLRRAAPGSLRPAACPGWVLPLSPGLVPAPAGPALVRPARRAAAQAAPEEDVPGAESLFVDCLRLDRRGGSGLCRVCRQLGGGRAPAGGLSGEDAAPRKASRTAPRRARTPPRRRRLSCPTWT